MRHGTQRPWVTGGEAGRHDAAGGGRRHPSEPAAAAGSAEVLGWELLGRIDDPATASWARAQLSRTAFTTAISAIQAVCEFTSQTWVSQIDVPTAVIVTAWDHLVPANRQLKLARAIPGASVHTVDALTPRA